MGIYFVDMEEEIQVCNDTDFFFQNVVIEFLISTPWKVVGTVYNSLSSISHSLCSDWIYNWLGNKELKENIYSETMKTLNSSSFKLEVSFF